jgi:glycosyltransferase involved in cell wall biosynthesis
MAREHPVTAVVSCYNQGEIIPETIDSLLSQSYGNLRILVVDDGSTDGKTIHALKELEKKDPERVEILFKENGDVSSARNFGIRRCTGEYVFISDGDDTYSAGMIERFVSVLDSNRDVGVVSSWIKTFGLAQWIVKPEGGGIKDFLHKNNCPGPALIRRKCWKQAGGYDEKMKEGYEDWDFYLSVTERGWNISIVKDPLIHYRIVKSSSNMAGYEKRLKIMSYLIRKHRPAYGKYLDTVLLEKEKALQNKNLELLERIKTRDDLPSVSFGDGGMAFAISALRNLGIEGE